MRWSAILAVLTPLLLTVGVGAPPVEDVAAGVATSTVCARVAGKLSVALRDHEGRPLSRQVVGLSDAAVSEDAWQRATRVFEKGRATSDDAGCAYLALHDVAPGKRQYYVYAFPNRYRTSRMAVTIDAAAPEAVDVIQMRASGKRRKVSGGCLPYDITNGK